MHHLRWKKAAGAIPLAISEMDTYTVRNSDELVTRSLLISDMYFFCLMVCYWMSWMPSTPFAGLIR